MPNKTDKPRVPGNADNPRASGKAYKSGMPGKGCKSGTYGTRVAALILCLALAFLSGLTPVLAAAGETDMPLLSFSPEKNILVLQSYHRGHVWSDQQGNAIIDALVKSKLKAAVFLEYMDWKRYPDEENLKLLYDRLQYKYSDKEIDLIMTTDDAALKFALEHRKELFSDAPIVFSGVFRQDADELLQGCANVTGVYQAIDPEATIRAAKKMIPGFNKIYLIHDKSESGVSTARMIEEAAEKNNLGCSLSDLSDFSLDQLMALVGILDEKSIVFLASYNSDINHVILPIQELAERISQNSSVPVFTIDEGILGSGGMGGRLTDAWAHGETAAEIGLRILRGEEADGIARTEGDALYWGFDYLELERYGISQDKLPAGSKVINKPFSFYEAHRTFVLSNLIIIIILFATTLFLFFSLRYRKKLEKTLGDQREAIYHLAYYSPVTGLPNRVSLKERLEAIIAEDTEKTERFALIYVDIDNFKEINDTFGHTVGDQVLHSFAERLRQMNGVGDNAFSLGGDEFTILIRDLKMECVEKIVSALFASLSKPFFIEDNTFCITVSGGIVFYPDQGDNYIELLRNADTAMYQSKEAGKGSVTIFDHAMWDEAVRKIKMQRNLREAMENGDFLLYYQPQLDAKTGEFWGYEALLRWNSPELGFLSPLSFIKVAEESHLIIPIGEWVLKTACRFIREIHDRFGGECVVSVNISVNQLTQEGFVETVLRILDEEGLSPNYLELEITESVFLNSSGNVVEKLEKLKAAGIGIALDDFGTGYSSLSYLNRLPITTLKIDKAFVSNFFESPKNMVLTNTIIKMGHDMGVEVVVEGVETPSQKELFIDLGCDRVQGYLVGKPAPDHEIFRRLEGVANEEKENRQDEKSGPCCPSDSVPDGVSELADGGEGLLETGLSENQSGGHRR